VDHDPGHIQPGRFQVQFMDHQLAASQRPQVETDTDPFDDRQRIDVGARRGGRGPQHMAAFEEVQARPRPVPAQFAGHRLQGPVEPRDQPRVAAERQQERGEEQKESAHQA
jgi:hypothetical protein